MILRILPEAEAEVEAARRYLNDQSASAGAALLVELERAFDTIVSRPLSFPKLETLPADQPYRRALLDKLRYAVVFEVLENEILVVAVTHCSREPNYWLQRPQ